MILVINILEAQEKKRRGNKSKLKRTEGKEEKRKVGRKEGEREREAIAELTFLQYWQQSRQIS